MEGIQQGEVAALEEFVGKRMRVFTIIAVGSGGWNLGFIIWVEEISLEYWDNHLFSASN